MTASCQRELARDPAQGNAGKQLAELHIEYESLKPCPLEWIETPDEPLSYVVEKMRLSKDKKSIAVNNSLTLAGIPPEVFDYRLGNRGAIEWVIDQYRVKEDKRSGIRSDPNNPDDPEYIVRLVGQVVRVSVETVKIVAALPRRYAPEPAPSAGTSRRNVNSVAGRSTFCTCGRCHTGIGRCGQR